MTDFQTAYDESSPAAKSMFDAIKTALEGDTNDITVLNFENLENPISKSDDDYERMKILIKEFNFQRHSENEGYMQQSAKKVNYMYDLLYFGCGQTNDLPELEQPKLTVLYQNPNSTDPLSITLLGSVNISDAAPLDTDADDYYSIDAAFERNIRRVGCILKGIAISLPAVATLYGGYKAVDFLRKAPDFFQETTEDLVEQLINTLPEPQESTDNSLRMFLEHNNNRV